MRTHMTSILLLVYNVHTGSLKISRESLEVSSHRITNENEKKEKRKKIEFDEKRKELFPPSNSRNKRDTAHTHIHTPNRSR